MKQILSSITENGGNTSLIRSQGQEIAAIKILNAVNDGNYDYAIESMTEYPHVVSFLIKQNQMSTLIASAQSTKVEKTIKTEESKTMTVTIRSKQPATEAQLKAIDALVAEAELNEQLQELVGALLSELWPFACYCLTTNPALHAHLEKPIPNLNHLSILNWVNRNANFETRVVFNRAAKPFQTVTAPDEKMSDVEQVTDENQYDAPNLLAPVATYLPSPKPLNSRHSCSDLQNISHTHEEAMVDITDLPERPGSPFPRK